MATKTPTRPKQRQSTQKRSWQNLTDRRKLRHLENTLDKAITRALQEGGIESHEDFKAYVESFSERSGKAPITVELCEGGGNDDEIRGYRFYLTSDPSQRTSGKYLIKNLEGVTDKDENYFTPSNIAEMFGFEEAEFDDLDADLDDALDLDDELNEEPDEDLDTLLDADLDDGVDELGDEEIASPPTAKYQAKTSPKAQSRTQSKTQVQGKAGKSNHRDFRYRDPMEEASRLSASAAVNGRETNGVNVAGLAGQLATLGIVVGQGVLENLAAQDDEERIERIVRELHRQNEQVDNLTNRLQEAATGRAAVTPTAEPEQITVENPLATAATTVGSKVDRLGEKLDLTYKSQPLELDREASISEQLDQIESYLKGLSKRLDRLEIAVSRLEKQVAKQTNSSTAEPEVNTEESQSSAPEQPIAESKVLEQLMARRADPQQVSCAESLVGFARVTKELSDDADQEGIAISSNKTLRMEEQGKQVTIALNNHQGNTLFAGNCTDGQWAIAEDHLNSEEKAAIAKLPQSKQEYATKASAQALIATFQEKLPERFNGEAEPVFTWKDQSKAKYEFEVVTLPNGTQLLQGFDPNHKDEQVFDAMLVPGQSPDILHCSIPLREMESVINDRSEERTDDKHSNRRSGKGSAKLNREELQV
ncbi:hypothetical protein HJG54_34530 (plasmid) [Leptolyngbya sp. NK1-12]|uniref:Uncharacterized protein n=1 Tax=Leptolyngbya sp. NK1-12 TaxID=2547451 RepID=A0AA96WNG5_9CYAN|nr:hypothetical protein [Leptolyngbya sp. NK1-12]WNZ28160.1 hypothetical protein HJG54_34530 [Leptolyngbya sp. NK1-12]